MNGETSPPLSFVGAMKIARNVAVSGRYDEWYAPLPAPSLRELSSECETEGVSSVGCSMPTIYTPAHINSETFERLRSSGYTPSVTPVGRDSSLREGAGRGLHHSTGYSLKSGVAGDFHRPYESSKIFTFHHSSKYTPSVSPCGLPAPSEREPGNIPIQPGTR